MNGSAFKNSCIFFKDFENLGIEPTVVNSDQAKIQDYN